MSADAMCTFLYCYVIVVTTALMPIPSLYVHHKCMVSCKECTYLKHLTLLLHILEHHMHTFCIINSTQFEPAKLVPP